MTNIKLFSIVTALGLSLTYGSPQHGQPGPRPGQGGNTGSGLTPVPGDGTVASVYDDATACWSFNDTADLGNDDCTDTYDLTLVNTPTATGGALGYSAKFIAASSQYGKVADNASVSVGSGVSWGFAGWARPSGNDNRVPVGKGDTAMATSGNYDAYWTFGGNFNCRFHDGTSLKTDSGGTVTSGARGFFSCRYNATANELEAGWNTTWSGSATSTAGDGADDGDDFGIGCHGEEGSNCADADMGPVVWYRSASGGQVLTDAIATSLYNSGKGKTCADLSDAEKVNLVSCWEMDEDGGPYVNDVNVTAVSASMATDGVNQHADVAYDASLEPLETSHPAYTVAAFVEPGSGSGNDYMVTHGSAIDGGLQMIYDNATPQYGCYANVGNIAWSGAITAQRSYVVCTSDGAGNISVKVNDVSSGSSAIGAVNGANTTTQVGCDIGDTACQAGSYGPVYYWDADIAAGVETSVYNSGYGKACGDLSGSELTDLVSCWDFTENGGPYADSIGSNTMTGQNTPTQGRGLVAADPSDSGITNGHALEGDVDLTAVNTPTQAAGLVERSDSGMSVNLTATQYLQRANPGVSLSPTYTVTAWANTLSGASGAVVAQNAALWANNNNYIIYPSGGTMYGLAGNGSAFTVINKGAFTVGAWHFYVLQYDGSTLYFDKDNSGSPASGALTGPVYSGAATFAVGNNPAIGAGYLGEVDNVSVWTRVLTSDELDTLWNSGAGTFYASAWMDMILNGPHYASNPIMLEPLRFPPPSARRFYTR